MLSLKRAFIKKLQRVVITKYSFNLPKHLTKWTVNKNLSPNITNNQEKKKKSQWHRF